MFKANILFKTRSAINFLLSTESKKKLSGMVFFSLLSALLDVVGIGVIVYIMQYLSKATSNFNVWVSGALVIMVFFVGKNVINLYFTKLQAGFAYREASTQSINVFNVIFSENEIFFKSAETGTLISDIMYVPNAFANGVILGYITLLSELGVLALMVIFLMIASFTISLLALLFIAPMAYISYRSIKNKVELLGQIRNNKVKSAQDILVQSFQARTDAVLYNSTGFFKQKFKTFQQQINITDASVFTLNNAPSRLMEIFAVMAVCLIYIFAKEFNAESSLAFNITLFVAAAFRLLPSVNRILSSMLKIKNHWFAVDALSGYEVKNKVIPESQEMQFTKNIILKDIKFKFGEALICDIDNFTLERGQCIGIYGDTGQGKSTFLQLLLQLIPAEQGQFFLDGEFISENQRLTYSRLFAYIKQDVFIFNAPLEENIALNNADNFNTEWIKEIVTRLELNKIKNLFQENRNAGEAGNNLSGGQKKLIALARALYFDKPIIVLDEALASLDPETVQLVLAVLKQEKEKGKTLIIVSHQKDVFGFCDIIYEFKNGMLLANL